MLQEILHQTEEKMERSLLAMLRDYQSLRAGKASASFLDKVQVPYYGAPTPLNQVAKISSPEPRQLVVQPYEAPMLKEIEKAILKANLGITPQSDGRVIRVVFPPLTEERRRELVKMAKKLAEECKIELRTHRRLANEEIKALKESGKVPEDERDRYLEKVQKLLDQYIEKTEDALSRKEQQIMEV